MLPNDVTRCASKTCPMREDCARATEIPTDYNVLSWFLEEMWNQKPSKPECSQFIEPSR